MLCVRTHCAGYNLCYCLCLFFCGTDPLYEPRRHVGMELSTNRTPQCRRLPDAGDAQGDRVAAGRQNRFHLAAVCRRKGRILSLDSDFAFLTRIYSAICRIAASTSPFHFLLYSSNNEGSLLLHKWRPWLHWMEELNVRIHWWIMCLWLALGERRVIWRQKHRERRKTHEGEPRGKGEEYCHWCLYHYFFLNVKWVEGGHVNISTVSSVV